MERTKPKDPKPSTRLLMRGERMIASTGLAVAAIFLLAIAAAGAWSVYVQRTSERQAATLEVESCGRLLARSAESLLAAEDLLAVRAMMVATAVEHRLDTCQLRFADASAIADSTPNKNTLRELPKTWPKGTAPAEDLTAAEGGLSGVFPVVVPGRGEASLVVSRN